MAITIAVVNGPFFLKSFTQSGVRLQIPQNVDVILKLNIEPHKMFTYTSVSAIH
jgi:hypothetical protein